MPERRIALWSLWLTLLLVGAGPISVGAESELEQRVHPPAQAGEVLEQWEGALPELTGPARIDALLHMAEGYRALGQVQRAFTALQQAYTLAKRSRDVPRQALVLGGLSDAYLLSRQVEEARTFAEKSVAAARPTAAPAVLATVLNHLGNALMAEQRPVEALQAYREGIALADQTSSTALVVTLMTNAVHGHLANDTVEAAIPMLKTALAKARTLPDSQEKAYDLVALGYLAQRLAELALSERPRLVQLAYAAFDEAANLAKTLSDPRLRSYATGHLGELYAAAQRFEDAEHLFRRALFFADQSDAPELLARWHWQFGRTLKAQGRGEAAEAAYRRALNHLASVQPALVFGYRGNPQSFRDTLGAVYLELAEILLERAGPEATGARRREVLRAVREVMENFKTVELKNYFQDDCVTEWQDKIQVTEVDKLLGSGTATLYPIVFPERIVLLLSLANGVMRQVDVPVSATELRRVATTFRQQLAGAGNPRRLRSLGWTLHDWLIKPVSQVLDAHGVDTVVVVPDDALYTIPFAALYDGKDFLVRRYAFVITPGLTLTHPKTPAAREHHVLLNGLSQSVQEFEPLPYVPQELERIASFYDSTRLLDDDFQKASVRTELERTPYSAILFATHARFLNDPKQSFLLAYDDKIRLDELDRFVRISQFRNQPVEVLVLSACETAEGDERAALGLAGVAVKAGASSVVASLWSVNDASTAELVPTFFEHLKQPDVSKARALQLAQQGLLADPRYGHPFHWASFVLIGSWF